MEENIREKIFEAHVMHELKLLQKDSLKHSINQEVVDLFDWFEEVSFKDLINEEQIKEFVYRHLIEKPVSKELSSFLIELSKIVYLFFKIDETKIEEVLSKDSYDRFIKLVINMDELRHAIIVRFVSDPVYSMLIADVLYNGIKDFILTENIIAKKIPGASSLIKMGQGIMQKAAPKLEDSIDKKLINFIQKNIQGVVVQSEKFLNKVLDEEFLEKFCNQLWEEFQDKDIGTITEYINAEDITVLSDIFIEIFMNLRSTPFFSSFVNKIIEYTFEENKDKSIKTIMEEIGLPMDIIINEANELLTPVIDKALATGYLEKIIRRRLKDFYFSDQFVIG